MAALDEFGNVLGHGMVFVIGKDEERRKKARTRLADMVKQHNVSVIAIGNGTGCRETEQLVADCLAEELKDQDVAYVIVNEAGASIYSTSPLGREELPQFDALQRGAISIGRRLLDPLSEMVKIHPANLGVGLYQHDIKAKHLKDSLDAVVESCVNFVGVDVNSASPALLRYVSGMNALTARRVYEHRREKGPFKNREELKLVPGFGEQTFVQAAGFLKVIGGENPLDATWIHPESYDIARRVLDKLGCDVADLAKNVPAPVKEEPKEGVRGGAGQAGGAEASGAEQSAARWRGDQESAGPTTGDGPELRPGARGPGVCRRLAVAASVIIVQRTSPERGETGRPDGSESAALAEARPAIDTLPHRQRSSRARHFRSVARAIPPPEAEAPRARRHSPRSVIAERAANVDAHQLATELAVGTHLLRRYFDVAHAPGPRPAR